MPLYTMRENSSGQTQTLILSLSEREEWLQKNPGWTQVPSAPKIVAGTGSLLSKTDDGWKELLGKVKKGSGKDNTVRN